MLRDVVIINGCSLAVFQKMIYQQGLLLFFYLGYSKNSLFFQTCSPAKLKTKTMAIAVPVSQSLSKKAILRRRDDDIFQLDCGIPKSSQNTIQKRIIGGRPAQFAEYPWQAHIRIAEYQCGGVLGKLRHSDESVTIISCFFVYSFPKICCNSCSLYSTS